MAAELKKVVAGAHLLDPEHLFPDRRDGDLGRCRRRLELCVATGAGPEGIGQSLSIDFSVRRERESVQRDNSDGTM